MRRLALLLVAAAAVVPSPLTVDTQRDGAVVVVNLRLEEELPEELDEALDSGATVGMRYRLEVIADRKWWWDNTLWKGQVTAATTFDPVTGRWRCQLLLDELIVDSSESSSAGFAHDWLTVPPPIRLVLPSSKKRLHLRARAVYDTDTVWLVFPSVEGTDWVEVPILDTP